MTTHTSKDDSKWIHINKVARAVKALAYFALYSKNQDCNLLITRSFVLNLTEDQFWKIQCKLEAKQIGRWFYITKEGLIEGDLVEQHEVDAYFSTVNNSDLEIIEQTGLDLGGIKLYAADGQYVGVNRAYVDMLGDTPALEQAADSFYEYEVLVAAGVHVLPSIKDIQSNYLTQLLFR